MYSALETPEFLGDFSNLYGRDFANPTICWDTLG